MKPKRRQFVSELLHATMEGYEVTKRWDELSAYAERLETERDAAHEFIRHLKNAGRLEPAELIIAYAILPPPQPPTGEET